MDLEREKQGHLGNLHEKTLPELLELLNRQESLLRKIKFLNSLPDKGKKVRHFADTLRRLISEREDVDEATSRLQGVQITVMEVSGHTTSNTTSAREFEKLTDKHELADNVKLERNGNELKIEKRGDNSVKPTGDSDVDDSLSKCFERVTLSTALRHGAQDQFVNSYERVMKRASKSEHRTRFIPSRTLNISRVQDLPEDLKLRSRHDLGSDISDGHQSPDKDTAQGDACVAPTRAPPPSVHEESAVHLPAYKYDKSVLISVEESVSLDAHRRKRLEDLQISQASERLTSRLHIRLDDYTPAETNMNYRETQGYVTDSDDEAEVEGYQDDG